MVSQNGRTPASSMFPLFLFLHTPPLHIKYTYKMGVIKGARKSLCQYCKLNLLFIFCFTFFKGKKKEKKVGSYFSCLRWLLPNTIRTTLVYFCFLGHQLNELAMIQPQTKVSMPYKIPVLF